MPEEKAFQEAVQAVAQGQIARARDLFTRLLKRDSSNPDYWLWMSAVVESNPERIFCLENVLQLDPDNQAAQHGLIILGARQADESLPSAPVIKRKWSTPTIPRVTRQPILQRLVSNRLFQVVGIIAAIVIMISLVLVGTQNQNATSKPTSTFIVVAFTTNPTPIIEPTPTPQRTITPSIIGVTPLWALLEATYTPKPPYINTPHPVMEAYKIALRAYERGDYTRMVSFLEQAYRDEPQSADITYLLGEGYRLLGNKERASDFFNESIERNSAFAPPYLGRALINLEINQKQGVSADLEKAIGLDPYYLDAYLAFVEFHLEQNNIDAARQLLEAAQEILPYDDARYYWLQARIYLAQEDFLAALEAAQKAFQLDQTLLPVYLTLAEAYFANNQLEDAIVKAQVFLRYEPEDPQAWLILAKAQYSSRANPAHTLKSLENAIELNPDDPEIYWYRGLLQLAENQNQSAVNDFLQAVRLESTSFNYNLDLGRALFEAKRYTDAYRQLNVAERLAEDDPQKVAVYYWRARSLDSAGNLYQAVQDWKRLLAYPRDIIPDDWFTHARDRLLVLETPTPSATFTPTLTPTPTRAFIKTPIP